MTRKQALTLLHLEADATPEDVERAYLRLVRRFPPEFHPDKFRQIDEAYRFLSSWSYRLEHLLRPEKVAAPEHGNFPYHLEPPTAPDETLLQAFRQQLRRSHLWEAEPPSEKKKTRQRRGK